LSKEPIRQASEVFGEATTVDYLDWGRIESDALSTRDRPPKPFRRILIRTIASILWVTSSCHPEYLHGTVCAVQTERN